MLTSAIIVFMAKSWMFFVQCEVKFDLKWGKWSYAPLFGSHHKLLIPLKSISASSVTNGKAQKLFDIWFGSICAVIAAGQGWSDIREYVLGHLSGFLNRACWRYLCSSNRRYCSCRVSRLLLGLDECGTYFDVWWGGYHWWKDFAWLVR